jgi:hypothetical protein
MTAMVTVSRDSAIIAAANARRFGLELLVGLSFAVLAIFLGTDFFSAVRFDQERIEIWAVEGQIQVHGLYHYQNRTLLPVSISLGLPFPVDPSHPVPSTFAVSAVDGSGNLKDPVWVRTYRGNNVFRLFFWPKQSRWIQVDYVQGTRAESGKYILRTTRKWNRPLKHGEYVLHLGKGLALASSTYPLEGYSSPGNQRTYSFVRVQFCPDEDWAFTWNQKTPTALLEGSPP